MAFEWWVPTSRLPFFFNHLNIHQGPCPWLTLFGPGWFECPTRCPKKWGFVGGLGALGLVFEPVAVRVGVWGLEVG